MHTFGFIGAIDAIVEVCAQYHIPVVEDAAESLGSTKVTKMAQMFTQVILDCVPPLALMAIKL